MSEPLYDFFGEVFRRYFQPPIDVYPWLGGRRIEQMFSLTDAVQDPLEQSRRGAATWGRSEAGDARFATEMFVITQQGLLYAAEMNSPRRALYYLATPPALFDPFVDQMERTDLDDGAVVVVDSRFGRDLAAARPMDAALRHILDEHASLRVDLPVTAGT
ncbi:glucose-6-phosphate dehydrogenase [Mycolicibacterium vaccae]|uniref:glucose-6-phosphate dehydrogenase n=1 Tax=Mycolicibacterium vaccae TaxID=1810 RepID=UPI003CF81C2B